MANIKNITTGNQYIDGYIDAWETKESDYILTNETKVHAVVYLHRNNSWNGNTYSDQVWRRLKINGVNVFEVTGNVTVPPKASGYVKIAEGSTTVKHDTDGSKKVSISIESTDNLSSTPTAFDISLQSGELTLTKIPRYATSNQSLNSKTETTITMNWSSDNTIDYVWYSTDWGTTWKAVGSVNAKSGSYTISTQSKDTSKLTANTTYNVITRVRRKDSQLTTNSSNLSVTTYDYPHCTESPNFTIGNYFTLSFYNPLNRSIKIYLIGANGAEKGGDTITGTSLGGYTNDDWKNWLYSTIPNSKSGKYQVKVVYGSVTKTRNNGNTYSIKGTEKPTIGTITYADTNATVTAITGDSSKIVQNQSNLKVSFTKATAQNSATISKHTFELNGVTKTSTSSSGSVDFGKIDSANSLTLKVTVTDSRGLTASTTKTITILEHSKPNAIVTLKRLNNYEDESYLTVDGSISSVNGKNTMAIKYRYKVSGGTYGESYTTIKDNTEYTLSLDKNNAYIFEVVITDAFGATYNREHTLGKGVFPLFIDTEKQSLGMNALPRAEKVFELDGRLVESEKEFAIPTNIGSKTGWYLAISGEFEYVTSKTFVISINEVLAGGTGILCLGMRYQNDTLRIQRFEWLTANGISSSNVKVAISGSKFYLYLKTTEDWQQYYLKVLQEKDLGGWNFRQYIVHYPTIEDTVEEPDGINPSDKVNVTGKASKNLFNMLDSSHFQYRYKGASPYYQSFKLSTYSSNEIKVTGGNGNYTEGFIDVSGLKPNTLYRVSYTIKENTLGFNPGMWINGNSSETGTLTINMGLNNGSTSASSSNYVIFTNIQLEEGAVITSYEEPFEPIISIKDSNGNFQEIINKVETAPSIAMSTGYSLSGAAFEKQPILEKQGKIVHLAMLVVSENGFPDTLTGIARLPAGFRPKYTQVFPCGLANSHLWYMDSVGYLNIGSDGYVNIRNSTGTKKYAFINITYITD